ncbi:IclR family transcriptional regulator [Nonomuraea salmonea]|uniref:IclR family transcriptional regulator n=1 Tax=Nonomuraea salmonea TaxID=46181 RepID=UPI002FEB6554
MTEEPSDLIRSVSRALRVLEEVSRADRPLSVKVIARRCGLNLSTSYHLVRTLCYEGYLYRCPDGDYLPGTQVAERFHEMIDAFDRPPRASVVLRHLSAVTGHTAYLAQLLGGRLIVLDVAEGPRSPWLEDLQAGLDTAPHATALGKALLLSLPQRTRRDILTEYGLRRFTSSTPRQRGGRRGGAGALIPGAGGGGARAVQGRGGLRGRGGARHVVGHRHLRPWPDHPRPRPRPP